MAHKLASNIIRAVKEGFLPLYMAFRKNSSYEPLTGRKDGLVVSLTTIPSRIDSLWITMDSLFRQKLRPDVILLVLTGEEFPEGMSGLPESLTRLQQYGLNIVFAPENLLCHNKYRWAFRHFAGSSIITVDDDCYYRNDMTSRLVDLSRRYPGSVCCNIAAIIDTDHFHEYKAWRKSASEHGNDDRCVALGFAGVLYPPHVFKGMVFDVDALRHLSPRADDLWLKACELVSGIKVSCGSYCPKPVTIKGSQKVSLRSTNKGSVNMNDVQWKALDEYFHLRERFR